LKKARATRFTGEQKLDFIESVWGYVEVVERRLAATGGLVYCVRNYASSLAVEFFTLSGLPGNPRGTKKIERCAPIREVAIDRAYKFARQESRKKSGKKSTR
jgi:hypothetical protein